MHDVIKGHWTHYALFGLAVWLIATALSFTHQSDLIVTSDIVAGVLVALLAIYTCIRGSYWTRWWIALVGLWLQFAPLAFWAPLPFSYLNDTLVGVLIIALAILLSKDPIEERVKGGGIPPGWSYNPSSWIQRVPVIFLALLAWMFARYMAAYQLGYLDAIWDPVFGDGTEKVITSKISKDFPVPDAGLGAMAYTIETLMGAHGSIRRWHSLPWFVALFALLVVPVGLTSIVLITLQPIIVGHWCFWCLLTAVCMLFMIAFAIDEVVASLVYLHQAKKEGRLFSVFWQGGDVEGVEQEKESSYRLSSMFWGLSLPWNLVVSALLGFWLMFSPNLLGVTGDIADLDHIFGALIITISVISLAEVIRQARFFNVLLGLAVLGLAWFSQGYGLINHLILGIVFILLALPKGPIFEKYGRWEEHIF